MAPACSSRHPPGRPAKGFVTPGFGQPRIGQLQPFGMWVSRLKEFLFLSLPLPLKNIKSIVTRTSLKKKEYPTKFTVDPRSEGAFLRSFPQRWSFVGSAVWLRQAGTVEACGEAVAVLLEIFHRAALHLPNSFSLMGGKMHILWCVNQINNFLKFVLTWLSFYCRI